MTSEEAKELMEEIEVLSGEDMEKAHKMAIKALEKQVPMKPYNCKTSGGQKGNMCPRCQRLLVLGYPQYCEFCGQAIDWSDVI